MEQQKRKRTKLRKAVIIGIIVVFFLWVLKIYYMVYYPDFRRFVLTNTVKTYISRYEKKWNTAIEQLKETEKDSNSRYRKLETNGFRIIMCDDESSDEYYIIIQPTSIFLALYRNRLLENNDVYYSSVFIPEERIPQDLYEWGEGMAEIERVQEDWYILRVEWIH